MYLHQGGLVNAKIHVNGEDIAPLIAGLARAEAATIKKLLQEKW